MTDGRRRGRRRILIAGAALAAMITGCQEYWRDGGTWDIDGHQGLLLDVSNYYHRHATEEGGRCRAPIMDGVTQAAVVEENDQSLRVQLRYFYRDFLKDGDDCDPKWRPLRCTIAQECTGAAARSFEIAKTGTGFEVIDMSGGRRR